MNHDNKEFERRAATALIAIKRTLSVGTGEFSVSLFVSHHLVELGAAYWKKHTGTPQPSAEKVLDLLVLRSHWGGEDDLDVLDFTLPDDATNYVISVRFEESGEIADISMES